MSDQHQGRSQNHAILRIAALVLATIVVTWTGPAVLAQDRTVESLGQQLDRLQRDLIDIQRFVYQNNVRAPESAAAAATNTPANAGEGANLASLELRMSDIERELGQITGTVEQLGFALRQLTGRVDNLVSDMDYRLQELERLSGIGETPAQTSDVPRDAGPQTAAAGTEATGTDESVPTTVQPAAAESGQAGTQTAALPSGSPMDQYNAAFSLLRQSAFEDAEVAFRNFVLEHPSDRLVGNAQYWLGETFFIRGLYDDAAVVFLDGYNQYPDSAKAPDMLLKLSITLNKLGQQEEACATLGELSRRFPNAEARVKDRASAEAEALNCNA